MRTSQVYGATYSLEIYLQATQVVLHRVDQSESTLVDF